MEVGTKWQHFHPPKSVTASLDSIFSMTRKRHPPPQLQGVEEGEVEMEGPTIGLTEAVSPRSFATKKIKQFPF